MYTRGGGGGIGLIPERGAEDVCIRKRRVLSRLSETRGVRKVIAACDRDGVAEAGGGLTLPVELRPAPGESIKAGASKSHGMSSCAGLQWGQTQHAGS